MGRLILVKCDCGYENDSFTCGINWAQGEITAHQAVLARSGRYGEEWKKLLSENKEIKVDTQRFLYQCPNCLSFQNEYSLDLYIPHSDNHGGCYYRPQPDEIIKTYKHICNKCGKRMVRINIDGRQSDEDLVKCPECGEVVIARVCGFTD